MHILWFELDQKPLIAKYWSQNFLYKSEVINRAGSMSRNRFELIVCNIHICNNETADTSDKMYKIRYLIDYLNETFLNMYIQGPNVCVDETMMAWRSRLSFRKYIPNKRQVRSKIFQIVPPTRIYLQIFNLQRKNGRFVGNSITV